MNHATLDDVSEILTIIKPYNKDIFPYLRKDYLQRKIETGNVIFVDDVVIIYGQYQRKQKIGSCQTQKGDFYISEIVSSGIPLRASFVLKQFFFHVKLPVWLTVREDNVKACKFYEKNGMKQVGNISWSGGKLPGFIYKKEYLSLLETTD